MDEALAQAFQVEVPGVLEGHAGNAEAVAARGHEIHILSTALPPRLLGFEDRVFFHEVTASPYPLFEGAPISVALASKMADVAGHHGLEIMHAHYAIPHANAALLARMALEGKLKVITTLHGTDITVVGADPSYLPMVKLAIRESDGVTAVSQYLKEETIRTFGVGESIKVIPNFVRAPEVQKSHCRDWLAPKDSAVLVHISNFRPVKRVFDVVRILDRVARESPAVLLMVGIVCSRLLRHRGTST